MPVKMEKETSKNASTDLRSNYCDVSSSLETRYVFRVLFPFPVCYLFVLDADHIKFSGFPQVVISARYLFRALGLLSLSWSCLYSHLT